MSESDTLHNLAKSSNSFYIFLVWFIYALVLIVILLRSGVLFKQYSDNTAAKAAAASPGAPPAVVQLPKQIKSIIMLIIIVIPITTIIAVSIRNAVKSKFVQYIYAKEKDFVDLPDKLRVYNNSNSTIVTDEESIDNKNKMSNTEQMHNMLAPGCIKETFQCYDIEDVFRKNFPIEYEAMYNKVKNEEEEEVGYIHDVTTYGSSCSFLLRYLYFMFETDPSEKNMKKAWDNIDTLLTKIYDNDAAQEQIKYLLCQIIRQNMFSIKHKEFTIPSSGSFSVFNWKSVRNAIIATTWNKIFYALSIIVGIVLWIRWYISLYMASKLPHSILSSLSTHVFSFDYDHGFGGGWKGFGLKMLIIIPICIFLMGIILFPAYNLYNLHFNYDYAWVMPSILGGVLYCILILIYSSFFRTSPLFSKIIFIILGLSIFTVIMIYSVKYGSDTNEADLYVKISNEEKKNESHPNPIKQDKGSDWGVQYNDDGTIDMVEKEIHAPASVLNLNAMYRRQNCTKIFSLLLIIVFIIFFLLCILIFSIFRNKKYRTTNGFVHNLLWWITSFFGFLSFTFLETINLWLLLFIPYVYVILMVLQRLITSFAFNDPRWYAPFQSIFFALLNNGFKHIDPDNVTSSGFTNTKAFPRTTPPTTPTGTSGTGTTNSSFMNVFKNIGSPFKRFVDIDDTP